MLLRLLFIVVFRLWELDVSTLKRICIEMSRSDRLIVCVDNLEIGVKRINFIVRFGDKMEFRFVEIDQLWTKIRKGAKCNWYLTIAFFALASSRYEPLRSSIAFSIALCAMFSSKFWTFVVFNFHMKLKKRFALVIQNILCSNLGRLER